MKYFLCGLIILGLIAISGCAAQHQYDEFTNYREFNRLDDRLNYLHDSMNQYIGTSFFFWSQESSEYHKAGNYTFTLALKTLIEIAHLQLISEETAEAFFKLEFEDRLNQYSIDPIEFKRVSRRALLFLLELERVLKNKRLE